MAPTTCPVDFQEEIECLGIEASPSFVREPQGNGVAERFIRTSHGDVQVKGVVMGDIRRSPVSVGIQRSEPDCMTRLVSEHDQPHFRSQCWPKRR